MKKRILSILLICCMVFSLFPVTVLAADDNIPFEDVKTTDWFYDEACYAFEKGLMQGTSSTTFDPTGTTSRAMIVTILYRLEGEPAIRNANVFTDVVSGSWYEKAVVWANGNGIVTGYGNGKFGPDDPITREQLAAILYRYADYKEYDVSAKADLAKFTDSSKISSYAVDAVAWANAAGLITGTGAETLDPQGSAVRAQAAAILMRFCENVASAKAEETPKPTNPTGGGSGGDIPTPSYSDLTIGEEQEVADGVYKLVGGTYGNLTIPESVGNGDVTLDGVKITGKLIVKGGGSNSVHLDSCTVDAIEVSKASGEAPRIELNSTPVEKIEAVKPVIIEADKTSAVKEVEAKSNVTVQGADTTVKNVTAAADNVKLTVTDAAVEKVAAEKPVTIEATSEKSTIKEVEARSNVTVQGAATEVKKVTVPESAASTGVELKIEGAKVAEVAAEKPVTIEATAGASPIESVTAKDNVTVQGAQIETVTVPENVATKPEITVTTGTVSTIEAKSEVKVEGGNNTVANVKAEAPVEVASAAVTTITVTVQVSVTVTVTGNQPVDVAVETTSAVSVVTTNTNVSVSTTKSEEINVVTKATVQDEGEKVTHVHKWQKKNETPATCTETGSITYECVGAGVCNLHTRTDEIPAKGHTADSLIPAEPATCTEDGKTAGKKCSVCGEILLAPQTVTALGHAYATVWSNDGEQHWHECTRDGCSATSAKGNHVSGGAATETADEVCTVCGYVITPSTGHQCKNHLTKTSAKAASCTAAGNSEYYTCTCGKFYSDANAANQIEKDSWIILATGHDYGTATYEWKAVSGGYTCTATRVCSHNANHKETETVTASYAVTENPTCQKEGTATYTAAFTSPFTQQTMDDVKIAKLLHTEVKINGTPATCEKTGLTDGVKCSVCNTVLVAQKEIPALGHDWATEWSKDSTQHWHECQREGCDVKGSAANHVPGEAATEDTAQTCTVCDYVIADALGHICKNHLTAHEAVDATCTAAGNSAYWSCTCGKYYSDANAANEITANSWVLTKLGHSLTKTEAKAATCTEAGNNDYWTCSKCNKVYSDANGTTETTVDAQTRTKLGHNYRAATYTWTAVDGGGYTCTGKRVCANNATHVDEATATVTSAVTKDATCTETGETTYTATFTKEGFDDQTKTEDIAALGHNYGEWIAEKSSSGTTAGTKGHYHCDRCGKDFDAQHQELDDLTIPASYASVSTEAEIAEVMSSTTLLGAVVSGNLSLTKKMDIPDGKSLTINGNLSAAQNSGINVLSGGSLTVAGSLTLATSSEEYWMNDSGSIQVQSGGSLNVGDVQYVGENGAFTLGDNTLLVLSGIPQDCASQDHQNGIFVLLTGNATVEDNKEFVVTDAWDNFILFEDTTLTVRGTLTNKAQIENRGALNVYGTLNNEGTIDNQSTIDVFGGTLTNSGTITGVKKNNTDEGYASTLAIEGGATLTNTNTGTINDCISVADYYGYGENKQDKICLVTGDFNIASVNFEKIAFAFDAAQIQTLLMSDNSYEIVMPCGTNATQDNTIDLGSITVPTGKTLLLKASVFDGTNVYRNKYEISSGKTLTLQGGAAMVGRSMCDEKVGLEINGTIVNNGGFIDFGQFTLSGENKPVIVHNATELATALAKGGKIYLLPFAQGQKTRVEIKDDTGKTVVSYESQYRISNSNANYPIIENTELIKLGSGDEPVAVFFDDGFTVNSGVNLKINDLNIVAVKNSTVSGTIEAHNGIVVVQGAADGATLTNEGTIVIGGENEWAALAIFDGSKPNKIVNNGIIENFGDLVFDRDRQKGQFEGNEPIEYASLRDLVCELNNRFGNAPNMESLVGLPEEPSEAPVEDLHWVYDYPDGGSQLFHGGNDPDFEAIAAFSWLIKNHIIPEYNKDTSPELRPYDLVTKARAAELLSKLATKIKGSNVTVTLTGDGLICKTAVNGRSELDDCVIAVRKAIGENIVQNAAELTTALANGGKIYLLPFAEDDENRHEDNWEMIGTVYESQYHVNVTAISKGTELIGLGTGNEMVAVFFDNGFTVAKNTTLKIDGLNIVAVKDSEVNGTIEARNGKVVVEKTEDAAQDTVLTINGKIFVGEGGALAIFQDGNKILNNGGIDVLGELIAPMGHNWDEENDQHQRVYVVVGNGSYINFYPDVMEFGKRLSERVEAYGLPAVTEEELADKIERAYEWPDLSEENEDRSDGFLFAVKYGLGPHTEKDDQGKDYIVWRPYDKIRYGEAMTVLRGVYKAIAGQDKQLPDSVALGDEYWTPKDTDCISDNDVNDLLNKFVVALPKVEDSTTTGFTVTRESEQVISNKTFTNPITITCNAPGGNDDFGGDIQFVNCAFDGGVTVKMTGGVGYNIRLNNNCTGAFTVIAEDDVIGQDRTNVNFFGMKGVTINGLTISGNVTDTRDEDFNVNVRYDEDGENSYIPTVEIYNSTDKTVTVKTSNEATYTGKLRVAGKLDISGVKLGGNSRIELSNQCDSEIALGSNNILVNDDCGGEYSFTGTGTVTVPNQNQYANITVNGINLGTPHVFGRNEPGFAIFFPLTSTNGVSIKVEQGLWNDDEQCVENWTELKDYTVNTEQGMIQLFGKPGETWLDDPYHVRVTVTVAKDEKTCTVVYDTMMWKPVQMDEFIEELNTRLSRSYTAADLGIGDATGNLTFGVCKTAFEAIWADFEKTDSIDMNTIINDERYWNELAWWETEYQKAWEFGDEFWIRDMENRNPDNWTRRWNDLDMMLDALTEALDISNNA